MRALGAEPPTYAHVPNVFGEDGRKLSKRHGAVSIDEFREAGYLAAALMNFLALLGWAPDGETTIMSREELIERFTLERVGVSPATFDYAKLDWMNGVYLRALDDEAFADEVVRYMRDRGTEWPEDRVRAMAPLVQEKVSRLGEIPAFVGFLFGDVEPDRSFSTSAFSAGLRTRWRRRRLVGGRARVGSQAPLRGARREAPHGVRPDPRGRDRLEGLPGPLRVARAARARCLARAAATRRRGGRMSVLDVDGFEQRLQAYAIERSEEARAVRVGEKETSEQAAIVARYAVLFTREQLTALEAAEEEASESEREAVARLRLTCQEGIVTAALAEREDELENALLAARVAWDGEQLPIRSARPGWPSSRTTRAAPRSARPCSPCRQASTTSDALLADRHELESDVTGIHEPVARNEAEKGVLLRPILGQSTARESRAHRLSRPSASAGSTACSGPSATRPRPVRTWPGSGGSLRSKPRTRRTGAWPSASRPCGVSASTSRPRRASTRTSRTVPRSRLVPA